MIARAGLKRHRVGVLVALLLVVPGVAHSASDSEKAAEPAPTVRIPTDGLGFTAPSAAYLSLRFALTTLSFIDNGHLLFTYHVNGLLERIPNDDANDDDQMIRAEVVDIASGKVTLKADWRMHDRDQYLWALNDGRFLVRQKNSLFLTDDKLELHPYLTFDTPLRVVELSPDRKLMLLEVQKAAPQEPVSDGPSLASAGSGADDLFGPAPKRMELILVRPGEKTVIARSEAKHIVALPLNDDGFIEIEPAKESNQWALRKSYFGGEPKEFGMVRSTCMPSLQPLSETVVLTIHCSANRTAGNKVVTAVSTQTGTLWSDQWQDKYIWENFEYATDGSRFAYESIEVNRPIGRMDSIGVEDVKGQPVGVFDTESGKLELVENALPVLSGGRNYALSADGRRFAILRNGAIEVYDLPPVPVIEKKDKK